MRFEKTRREIVRVARQMLSDKLVTFTAGNISVRVPESNLVAITPTSYPYDLMKPEDVPLVNLTGEVVEGALQPSSETPMHTLIMRARPDVNAVVHTHSPYALAFAVAHKPIPLISLEGLATCSMSVLVAEYATPGTEEIGLSALQTLERQPGSQAVLLANHGLLVIGKSLSDAYATASKVETEAMVYHLALTIGTPVQLTEQQVHQIRQQYVAKQSPRS